MPSTIISCAVTGSAPTPDKNPAVPVTPAEIAASAIDAAKAGAAIVHIHVRDPETTTPSMDPAHYREVTERIRDSDTDVIINLTTGPGARYIPDPDDPSRPLIDSIDLIVPHQANKTMILGLADKAGLTPDQLYFNIETMGNVSAASIPIAIADAVRDGVITKPVRVFAPGFGAGAVGGYAVLRVDPAVVAPEAAAPDPARAADADVPRPPSAPTTSDDVRVAFGE